MSKPRPRKKAHWVKIESAIAPSERTPETSMAGQRFVHVRTMIDSRGRMFEKVGRSVPEQLEDPPD